jgi:hypothetical protein
MKPRITATVLAALFLCLTAAHARTWTSSDGTKTFEGELHAYDADSGKVTVKLANGKELTFLQDKLSQDDIAFLEEKGTVAPEAAAAPQGSSTAKAKAVPEDMPDPDGEPADMSKPVQVFILMGQSNMVGFGKVAGGAGSLENATKEGKYPYLVDDAGAWNSRKDVRNAFIMTFKEQKNDWLTPADTKNIGPEMGFGWVIGEALDAPVLLVKSCIGNRSLGWDLLPPGSERFEAAGKMYAGYKDGEASWAKGSEPKAGGWYAGKQYDDDIAGAKQILSKLDKYYPGAKEYEIAGFVFWQGDKDRYDAVHAERYGHNLANFIKALRKDFDAPGAKFVLATLGQTKEGSGGNDGKIFDGMMSVDGDKGKHPEFKGNVATVYAHPLSKGSSSNAHYGGNAETYMNVGLGLGRAMVELLAR